MSRRNRPGSSRRSPTVPDLRLRPSVGTRAVAGRVVDSAGKSVAGAEVYQSGDGPKKTRGTTDADGRFRVPGVPKAPAFLFVAKEGFHFLGRRVDPKDDSVEFTLRRLDEPPAAPLRSAAPPVPRDEERAIARALIAEVQKASGTVHEVPDRRQLPEITALVDPDRVIAMIENQVLTAEPGLLTALAVARFEDDPRKALEMLDAIDQPAMASSTALGLFDRLGATATPEFRRDLLERAARRPPISEDPGQAASLLARIADRWLDLGETDRGSVLVRKAQVLAEKPRQQSFPDPRDDIAMVLARIDLPAALKLLEGQKLQSYQLERLCTAIANRIAATHPAAARRLLGRIEEYRRPSARRVVCLRMAVKDLPAARALAAEDRNPMVEALLPAVAAQARAKSDPDGARGAVARSGRAAGEGRGRPDDPARRRPSRWPGSCRWRSGSTPTGRRMICGSPWHDARRCRTSPCRLACTFQARQQYFDLAELAVLVARYDRSAAEVVFAPVADRLARLVGEQWGLGSEGPAIFRAAGTFDARVARTLLDALPEDPPPPAGPPTGQPNFRHHTKAEARIALARILGLPPALRLREPFLPHGDIGFEEFED